MQVGRLVSVALLGAAFLATAAAPAAATHEGRAAELLRSARRHLAGGSNEARQFARAELEEAHAIVPKDTEVALALAGACLAADMHRRTRQLAQRVLERDPENGEAQYLLALSWRADWLTTADESSRDRAIVWCARSVSSAPRALERWRTLVPLLVDAGEDVAARDAATLAWRASPANPDARLLLAYTAVRTGDIELADRLFRGVLPQLSAAEQGRYDDVATLVPPSRRATYEGLSAPDRRRFAERLWREADPDPMTPENEARLEYWARIVHASLLWEALADGQWDMRAQLYVRYGPPALVERNPTINGSGPPNGNWLVWTYASLGMRVWMQAADPQGGYRAPFTRWSWSATPFRDSLAGRADLQAVGNGWAVFPRWPAGTRLIDVRCALARYEAADGTRLLAHAEAAGHPGEPLRAEWAVIDTGHVVVATGDGAMGASACDPVEARAASFAPTLPPGRYHVVVRVTDDADGGRGLALRDVVVGPVTGGLALSDLAVVCGSPELAMASSPDLRLELETGLVPATSDRLCAYVEIYHLASGSDGQARFGYVCTVRPVLRDTRSWLGRALLPRPAPSPIEMSRSEQSIGSVRRQLLSIPVDALPGGRYEVEVRVRDVHSGAESSATAQFVKP